MLHIKNYKNVFILVTIFVIPAVCDLPDGNIANKYFLEKQKFLFEIVHDVQEPLQNEDWIKMGRTLIMDQTKYLDFNDLMKKFALKANASNLLPLSENFYLKDKIHLEELKGLYYFLYNAQDFETLRQNICWARIHVQAQMFVYALTQTLMKREDFKDLNLPKVYEIWPQHFFADKYIRQLQHFNYVQWSKADTLDEILNTTNTKPCKIAGQWWCKEHLQFKIYKESEHMILPKNIYGDFRNSSKWLQALEDVSFYWLPVDFSTEVAKIHKTPDKSVAYLIEDKSWNAYWYYINMGLWLNERGQNDLYSKSLRDWWFWNLQQIVVKYKMETTLSENISKQFLSEINPSLKYKTTENKNSHNMWNFINDLFSKTEKALYEQTYELKNKTRLQLNNPEHLEYFLNENFAVDKVLWALMSLPGKQKESAELQYLETMLRSQEFYTYAEILVNLYRSLKTNFEPYRPQDLQSSSVTVNDVEIAELKTYFEIIDTDVTNLMRPSNNYFEGKFLWFKSLMARQQNLQHQPFKFVFNVTADKQQAILVRTFLARDCQAVTDELCSLSSNEYFQLDTFVSSLAVGYNIVERESKDFYGFIPHSLSYSELYHFTDLAFNEQYQFPLNIKLGNCRFPHHLKLPKGLETEGLPVRLVFIISTYNYRFHKGFNLDCDFSSGILAFDNMPAGFPFDREISEDILMQNNVLVKRIKIFHDENLHFR